MQEERTISDELRAQILIDALPYIQKYYNKVKLFVICGYMEDSGNGPQINYAGSSRKREKVPCM